MNHFIIDCDPGHDDAVAMLVAAHHLDLVGVTTVFGNSSVDNTTHNALSILDAAGLTHIPVARGAKAPLEGVTHSGETVHGKTGLDGVNLPSPKRSAVSQSASEFIAEMAHQYDDLVVIAVAPQTNLATALREHPGLEDRIQAISVMGGSTGNGNATAAAEFNIFADPEAASIVFDSGVPITMAGLNVTTTFGISPREIDQLLSSKSAMAREIGGALSFYYGRQNAMYGRTFAPMHDLCAVVPFSHPGLVQHKPMHVVVECEGQYTRGMTVCDQRGLVEGTGVELSRNANAQVAVALDGDGILSALLDTLCEFP